MELAPEAAGEGLEEGSGKLRLRAGKFLSDVVYFLLPSALYNLVYSYSRDILTADATIVTLLCYLPKIHAAVTEPRHFDLIYVRHVLNFPQQRREALIIAGLSVVLGTLAGLLASYTALLSPKGFIPAPSLPRNAGAGPKFGMALYVCVLTFLEVTKGIALPRYHLSLVHHRKMRYLSSVVFDFLLLVVNEAGNVLIISLQSPAAGIFLGAFLLITNLAAVLAKQRRGLLVYASLLLARYLAAVSCAVAWVWTRESADSPLFSPANIWTRVSGPL